jgi:hypothetical protein
MSFFDDDPFEDIMRDFLEIRRLDAEGEESSLFEGKKRIGLSILLKEKIMFI